MRRAVLIFVTLAIFASTARAAEVVPAKAGYPALTQEMLDRGTAFVEWAMGVEFTSAQRAKQQGFVIDHWKSCDAKDMGSMLELLDLDRQIAAMSAAEKAKLPEKVRPAVLESLRQESAEGDAEAKWLLDVHESYIDRPVVEGNGKNVPPLTA
jgi:hypothetical protein